MQKVIIAILAAAAILFSVLYARERGQTRASQARIREVEQARQVELESRRAEANTRIQELERDNARLEKQVQQFTSVTTMLRTNEAQQSSNATALAKRVAALQKSGAQGGAAGAPMKGVGEMLGQMMKDPAMRDMLRDQQKATINLMYSGLFKELSLNPEEKEKLKELLTDMQMRNIESAQNMMAGKTDASADTTAAKQIGDTKKETEAAMRALLGDDRYAQYEDYQKNIGERMQLDQLRARFAADNVPLQDQQYSQLYQIMQDVKTTTPPAISTDQSQTPRRETFTAENVDKQLTWLKEYNDQVYSRVQAAGFLNAEQLKQYKAFQEQQASMQTLGLNMARQMFGNSTDPAAPGAPPTVTR